jgi:hypothetical protein
MVACQENLDLIRYRCRGLNFVILELKDWKADRQTGFHAVHFTVTAIEGILVGIVLGRAVLVGGTRR